MKAAKTRSLWVVALVVAVVFVWCWNRNRLTIAHWDVPFEYGADVHAGDSQQILGWIKAASEWNYIPFCSKTVDRLGAPYAANWNDYPMYEEILTFFLGILARLFGIFKASNLGMLLAHVTAAVSFYCCCRLLKFRREWAWAGAILFAFAYYTTWRSLGHLLLAFTYTVPLAILGCWLVVGSKRLRWGDKFCWLCAAVGVIVGLSNPYNLNMYAQLLCLSIAVHFLTRRRRANLQIGILSLALAILGFLATNLDTFSYQMAHGKNPGALLRGYYETELFALKPIELVIPPVTHQSRTLAEIGSAYVRLAWIRGELFSPYLGVIGLAGLIWMCVEGFFILLKIKRVPRRFPAYAPQALWVLLYSVVGGLNCMIALAGVPLFRSSNRYSIFLSAFSLFFLVSKLSGLSRRWRPALRFSVAGLAVLVGLYDELPPPTLASEVGTPARLIQADREFTEKMEAALPAGGMVFQLPVVPFPDSTQVLQVLPYEMLRPYFFSKTLRFSFGSSKGRSREDWQKEVEKMPVPQMIHALERYGFSAIYLNRRGFADRGDGLIQQLAELGKRQVLEDDLHEQVCILLNASPTPELPPADASAPPIFEKGWPDIRPTPTGSQCWASGNASLSFFNPDRAYSWYSLNCQIASPVPRRISIEVNGRELWSANLGANQLVPLNLPIEAKPRYNKVRFRTDTETRPSRDDPSPRAFIVINPQITRAVAGPK